MKSTLSAISIMVVLLYSLSVRSAYADLQDRIEFSGFGRVVGGYLDTNKATYEGYANTLSFSQESLLALQSDVKINDTLSFSAQLLGHADSERESGLEWMYLTYQPSPNWQFKAGKLRTPFFHYSDVVDIGFSYPWVSPPQEIYTEFLFSNYEGISSSYSNNAMEFNFEIEGYFGAYKGSISTSQETVSINDEILGLILHINKGNFNARVSGIKSVKFDADVPSFKALASVFRQAGFEAEADDLRLDKESSAYQASVTYDTLDYFLLAEWVKATSKVLAIPSVNAYYLTAGYNFAPFQAHITYSVSSNNYSVRENTIPTGVSAQLDELSQAYGLIIDRLYLNELDSIKLGLRWDFKHNFAVKTEITFLNGTPNQRSFYSDIVDSNFDRNATLYQFAIEWVF